MRILQKNQEAGKFKVSAISQLTNGRIAKDIFSSYSLPFLVINAVSVIVYGYFFTHTGFTNHTLPNVWIYNYPSFKTTQEGRWFADILIQLTGGSGVPTVQITLAAAVQAANGLLFGRIFRLEDRVTLGLVGAFIALHPAFLDYYSFTVDHVSFVTGDLLVLVGAWFVSRRRDWLFGAALPAACFVLAIATYQPKIAFVAFMLIAVNLQALVEEERPSNSGAAMLGILRSGAIFFAAVGVYAITICLTVRMSGGERQHINGLTEILTQTLHAYPKFAAYFWAKVDYLPRVLSFLPLLAVVGGLAALGRALRSGGGLRAFVAAILVVAIPPALELAYVVNSLTWTNNGRILFVHAYFLAFALALALRDPFLRRAAQIVAALMVYFFAILATQESNAASLREVFDVAKMNRILARVEELAPPSDGKLPSLVVIGELSFASKSPLRSVPNNTYFAHVRSEPFVNYRQVEIMNFLAGHSMVQAPTPDEIALARAAARDRRPWPSLNSVFERDGVFVVLLAAYADNLPATWPRQ